MLLYAKHGKMLRQQISINNNAYRLNTASHNILKKSDLLDR